MWSLCHKKSDILFALCISLALLSLCFPALMDIPILRTVVRVLGWHPWFREGIEIKRLPCLVLFLYHPSANTPYMGVSKNNGTPKSSHFNMVFHYKPSILGYPYFWKHLYLPMSTQRYHLRLTSHQTVLQARRKFFAGSMAEEGRLLHSCWIWVIYTVVTNHHPKQCAIIGESQKITVHLNPPKNGASYNYPTPVKWLIIPAKPVSAWFILLS